MVSTATAVLTLDSEAFNQLVLERGLKTWSRSGYIYTGFKGAAGWELYRAYDGWLTVPVTRAGTANPAAGAEWAAITVPTGKRWLFMGAYSSLATDANVANRYIWMYVQDDGSNSSRVWASNVPITASLTTVLGFTPGVSGGVAGAAATCAINDPGIELQAGAKIYAKIGNIQAGDDATALSYVYKEVDA